MRLPCLGFDYFFSRLLSYSSSKTRLDFFHLLKNPVLSFPDNSVYRNSRYCSSVSRFLLFQRRAAALSVGSFSSRDGLQLCQSVPSLSETGCSSVSRFLLFQRRAAALSVGSFSSRDGLQLCQSVPSLPETGCSCQSVPSLPKTGCSSISLFLLFQIRAAASLKTRI